MNKKKIKFQWFDFATILICSASVLSLCFYTRIPFTISLILLIIAIWALLTLAGRLIAPLYLEGRMIRNLIANNGRMPIEIFEKFFKEEGLYDELIQRLSNRDVISIQHEMVILKDENHKKGLQNRIMMWGTRNLKY